VKCQFVIIRQERNEVLKYKYFVIVKNVKENGEIFYTLKEAKTLIEQWRVEYNTFRPHSSLNCRPPAPEAYVN